MNETEILNQTQATLVVDGETYSYNSLHQLEKNGFGNVSTLPFSIKALLESALHQVDGKFITENHIRLLAGWMETQHSFEEVPFKPARIVLQDFTGVPAIVDLAAMRSTVHALGQDFSQINPQIPVDLVVDHSVIIDAYGDANSFHTNIEREFERNAERYRFVRWAQQAFDQFRVVPPASGIVHQVNLEHLATSVVKKDQKLSLDTLVGTDSHTPMINGLGTIGWGVGGIEAEAAMLGQPLYFVIPEVVGVRLVGQLQEGSTATDIALTVTNLLREHGVVGKIVEFYGPSLDELPLADRATIANMAPEYGATMSFFPTDALTLDYLELTGRTEFVNVSKAYHEAQGLFRTAETKDPVFTEVLEINLNEIVPSLAGPKRPQDKVPLTQMKEEFIESLTKPIAERGYGLSSTEVDKKVLLAESKAELQTGSLVLAAITSCTNTSNPHVMIAAGLVAKKAVEKGLVTPGFVKTTLTPGSTVVTEYLRKSGLLTYLEQLGFFIDGYGCAACCGNTGPLKGEVEQAIQSENLIVSSVLSGNRNFEGRVHPLIKANYLASPPLVVAYALAGTVVKDLSTESLATNADGEAVYLSDIWPSSAEIDEVMKGTVDATLFQKQYEGIFENERWLSIDSPKGPLYEWDPDSTYIQEAPFLKMGKTDGISEDDYKEMSVLLHLGDSITTDHISPVGSIGLTTPAGEYLSAQGVSPREFNSYGSRRGNHHVMVRGTFANIRLRNELAGGIEGGFTKYLPTGEILPVYDAAMKYQETGRNLMIIAGKEYGTGSSRDWAAKGTALLGVKVVLAESFERIHRSNLVGLGVLPLQFKNGENGKTFGLTGTEQFEVVGLTDNPSPRQNVQIKAFRSNGETVQFDVIVRLDSVVEVETFAAGGILPAVMRQFVE